MKRALHIIVLSAIVTVGSVSSLRSSELVFPGAEGFGVTSRAGNGGHVYRVTTLEDDGLGSLREAVRAKGPRTVVFEVSGTIELKKRLRIKNPFLTILGQTAPSPGITVRGHTVNIQTHDVLIQHIRIRIGDGQSDPDPRTLDGLQINAHPRFKDKWPQEIGTYNVVIDHCSISWGIDENVSVRRCGDVTISNCIISEALDASNYTKGHSMAMLVGRVEGFALINNLIAHCASRTPKIGGGITCIIANNVIYNPRYMGIEIHNVWESDQPKATVVGNVVVKGPDSRGGTRYPLWLNRMGRGAEIYADDNPCAAFDGDPWSCVKTDSTAEGARVNAPPVTCEYLTIRPSHQTLDWVLRNVGARPLDRDAVDARIVSEVRARTGRIINHPSDAGGWDTTPGTARELEPPIEINKFDAWLLPYTREVEGDD